MIWSAAIRSSALVALVACVALTAVSASYGQESSTRAGTLKAAREKKAAALSPYKPNAIERALTAIEEDRLIQRIFASQHGFYPRFGSIARRSGFSLGAGYRRADLFDREGRLDVWAAGSLNRYWIAGAELDFPELARRRAFVTIRGTAFDFPREEFYGLGPTSLRTNQTSFALSSWQAGVDAGVRAKRNVRIGGMVQYHAPDVRAGKTPRVPDIGELFAPADVPGLQEQPDFVQLGAFVEADLRSPGANARRGGYYRLEWSHFDDRDLSRYAFGRLTIDLRQYLGFFKDKRVLALRALYSTSDTGAGQQVPFYFQPTLGGPDSLRGFREFRFRGPHLALFQAEYRVEIWPALDLAFFYDRGQVALERSDLRWSSFDDDYGLGLRFGSNRGVFLRVETAFGGREGHRFIFRFGNVF